MSSSTSFIVPLHLTPRTAAPTSAASARQSLISLGVAKGRAESCTATRLASGDVACHVGPQGVGQQLDLCLENCLRSQGASRCGCAGGGHVGRVISPEPRQALPPPWLRGLGGVAVFVIASGVASTNVQRVRNRGFGHFTIPETVVSDRPQHAPQAKGNCSSQSLAYSGTVPLG